MTGTDAQMPFGLGGLGVGWLIAALFVVAMLRANATYWIGRAAAAGGRHTRLRRVFDSPRTARAEAFVARWGVAAVPLCFLTVGVQTAVNLGAGAARMPLRRYLPAVALGALLWAVLYATAGLAVVVGVVSVAARSPWVLGAVAVVVLVGAGARWRRHRGLGKRRSGPRP